MNAAGHAPDVASAANISAFTLGSAIGIYLGGAAIDSGLGLASVNWIGGSITTAGLLIALVTYRAIGIAGESVDTVDAGHEHVH
jgi:predicted MFS family arabinose efflux permease